jgi:hypothetical protein
VEGSQSRRQFLEDNEWRGEMVEQTLIETGKVAHVSTWYRGTRRPGDTDHDAVDFCATISADSRSLPTMLSAGLGARDQ